jgi:hypothetical protein
MWWSGHGNLYYYPDENWATAGGYVCPTTPGINPLTHDEVSQYIDPVTNPARYPEERIRWRHESENAFKNFNAGLRDMYATEMMNRQRQPDKHVVQRSKDAYRGGFLEEISWKLGPNFPKDTVEEDRDTPSWDDLVDYRTVITKDIGYSWRTINFLRMLAFRMGHTIRHCKEVAKQTSKHSALTRQHLYSAFEEWERGVNDAHEDNRDEIADEWLVPFKAATPNAILAQIDPKHKDLESNDMTVVFRTIRHGIIEDMVKNRTMLYPARYRRYTNHDKRNTFERYERDNIWSWASEPIRKCHAAYRRPLYFDMRRWPLNRQKQAVQKEIANREDEDPTIQPVSAFYKYNLRVGPAALIPKYSDLISSAIMSLHDSDKERVAHQLINRFSEQMVKMVGDTKDYDQHWQIEIVPPKTLIPVKGSEQPKLQPKSEFLPGRAIFPMGDTLRQQLKISHDIEQSRFPFILSYGITVPLTERVVMHPKPNNFSSKIMGTISGLFKAPPERVTLLPDIDMNRAPTSNPLKRKVPSSFANRSELPSKIQALVDSETNQPASPLKEPKSMKAPLPQNLEAATPPVRPSIFSTRFEPEVNLPITYPNSGSGFTPQIPTAPLLTPRPTPKFIPVAIPKPIIPAGLRGGKPSVPFQPLPVIPEQEKAGVEQEKQDDQSWRGKLFPILGPTVPKGSIRTPFPSAPIVQLTPPTIHDKPKQDHPKPPNPGERRLSVPGGSVSKPEEIRETPEIQVTPLLQPIKAGSGIGLPTPVVGTGALKQPTGSDDDGDGNDDSNDSRHPNKQKDKAYVRELQRRAKLREIRDDFGEAFPRGWRLVGTPGDNLECGLYAVIGSVAAQLQRQLRGEVPTLAELRRLIRTPDNPDQRTMLAALGIDNTNNLSVDQVAAALLAWGLRRDVHLRLAVYRAGDDGDAQEGGLPPGLDTGDDEALEGREGGPQLIFCPVPDPKPHQASYTIWIHSNETDEAAKASKKRDLSHGRVLTVAEARELEPAKNHFSGMEPV